MSCSTNEIGGRAVKCNITIEQGATFDWKFTWRQAPTKKAKVSAITKANPGKVTAEAHSFASGETVYLSALCGMAQADNRAYTATVLDADSFTLGVDTSSYDAYVSGGKADNGKPIDLTGYTARMHVRAKITDASAVLDLTTANGGIVLGGTAGTTRVRATAAQTAALSITSGVYDLEVIPADTSVRRLLYGTATLSKEVTR